ncbi:hypothetical protein GJ496_002002 [Pomphorhynchus laevis]|nr:hypothetical protein GJ496_002692 [Pomphorhynchus laevis]KAI0983893.1 hypothetical protein GJ496_002002 [Pomphorhynchus laevis]
MKSINPDCQLLKDTYDNCFNQWLKEVFLRGKSDGSDPCIDLFSKYQKCVKDTLRKKKIEIKEPFLEDFSLNAYDKNKRK